MDKVGQTYQDLHLRRSVFVMSSELQLPAIQNGFPCYRAMHYSAKRGLAIACRLAVCLSVTLVDQDSIG